MKTGKQTSFVQTVELFLERVRFLFPFLSPPILKSGATDRTKAARKIIAAIIIFSIIAGVIWWWWIKI
jgi:hypothetical protein